MYFRDLEFERIEKLIIYEEGFYESILTLIKMGKGKRATKIRMGVVYRPPKVCIGNEYKYSLNYQKI